MDHPEYVTYVVIVYAVTFGLLAAYGAWLWQRLRAEKEWARRRAETHSAPGHAGAHRLGSADPASPSAANAAAALHLRGERHD